MMPSVLFFGNCQVEALSKYALSKMPDLDAHVYLNYELIGDQVARDRAYESLPSNVDFTIYQPLASQHGWMETSDSAFFARVESNERYCVPYMYNNALWPTFIEGDAYHHGDTVSRLVSLPDEKKALDRYLSGDLDFKYSDRMKQTLEHLSAAEQETDVAVADFIQGRFREERLFFTQNHPTSRLFAELISQLQKAIPGLFPTPAEVLRMGENFANLPSEWPVEFSAQRHWQFEWTSPFQVAAWTREFIDMWGDIRRRHFLSEKPPAT